MTVTPYATLDEVKADLTSNLTVADSTLMGLIRQVSGRIDRKFWQFNTPFFAPYIEQRDVPLDTTKIISWNRTFRMSFPILSASAISINSTTLVIGTDIRLYPPPRAPYWVLQLINNRYSWYALAADCSGCDSWQQPFVSVTGSWGWNTDPANMWLAVDAITTVGGINGSVTTFTVADVDGANPYGITPRISAGNLLQVESEWMLVISTVTASNTVNVIRGVNGSTAAVHAQSASVQVYQVDDSIKRATIRQVAMQYAKRGAYNAENISDGAAVDFPPDTLQEFNGLLQLFANMG